MQNVSIILKALTTPSTRRALILGCLLQLFQQVAGINTVMYYSAKIISLSGISDDTTAIWMSSGVASVNFFCTFIGKSYEIPVPKLSDQTYVMFHSFLYENSNF